MTDQGRNERRLQQASASNDGPRGLFDGFEGYRTPTEDDYHRVFTEGLVVPDSNVLLNLYRYNEQTRSDLLAVLDRLGERLWIPNQVLVEFWRNRESALKDPQATADSTITALSEQCEQASRALHTWANRIALPPDRLANLQEALDHGFTKVKEAITGLLDPEAVEQVVRDTGTDRVLHELDRILRGHVGAALEAQPYKEAIAEGMRRISAKVPPGYKDKDKDDEDAAGDYLVWEQILREAERRQCNVLLVTADVKEDWWRKDHGQARGPRLELVEEMRRRAGVRLFMLRPDSLLLHARQVLEVEVRDESVQDIERVDKSFAEGESQVQHVKETLVEDFERKAEWRDQKAEEWPDDTRNARAAEGLRGLGQYVRTLPDDDPRLRRIAWVWSSDYPDGDAAQRLLDTYGFGSGSHLGPPDHDSFLTDYANGWKVSSWR